MKKALSAVTRELACAILIPADKVRGARDHVAHEDIRHVIRLGRDEVRSRPDSRCREREVLGG